MMVCFRWLGVEFFVRHGFVLEATPDGRRQAVRGHQRYELPAECGHEDCPPHPTATILEEVA